MQPVYVTLGFAAPSYIGRLKTTIRRGTSSADEKIELTMEFRFVAHSFDCRKLPLACSRLKDVLVISPHLTASMTLTV